MKVTKETRRTHTAMSEAEVKEYRTAIEEIFLEKKQFGNIRKFQKITERNDRIFAADSRNARRKYRQLNPQEAIFRKIADAEAEFIYYAIWGFFNKMLVAAKKVKSERSEAIYWYLTNFKIRLARHDNGSSGLFDPNEYSEIIINNATRNWWGIAFQLAQISEKAKQTKQTKQTK